MSRAIRMIELQQPLKCQHNFKGGRWQELVEIHALEQLAGGLTPGPTGIRVQELAKQSPPAIVHAFQPLHK